ncbi:unnamed protein product [Mytilus edulis]|uniref:Reverse transcriptase domain-containing protein n=1 Tax=Mytilus edulis TaxID=6550 RepID=A0A8S3QCT7_MYTED|nr:unnamed protein product [Mytilus edulis]
MEQDNIISSDFAESLNFVKTIDTIDTIEEIAKTNELSHDFPELIKTSGTLPGEYRLTIAEMQKTIEDVIPLIPDAKVFSVLDAKSGFLQIKLEEPSPYLTTFNAPIGRYRWLRLPFGIKSAAEIYQRIMDQMLEGITGATAITDDILIAGRNMEEYDKILKQVVERAT